MTGRYVVIPNPCEEIWEQTGDVIALWSQTNACLLSPTPKTIGRTELLFRSVCNILSISFLAARFYEDKYIRLWRKYMK
jgi:hypothetical protein